MNSCLLVIIAAPSMEEVLVDWLLAYPNGAEEAILPGFTALRVDGHSVASQHLSLAEQVMGRQRRLMFQIQLAEPVARDVVGVLKHDFPGADLHYWIMPLIEAGTLL